MPRIVIDPGHGGSDPGAIAVNGRPEKESNLAVALKVWELLQGSDVQVILTRTTDSDVSLAERCKLANKLQADAFISLHADWSPNAGTKGHHAICSIHAKPGEGGHKLATLLVTALTEHTGRAAFHKGVWQRASDKVPGRDYYAVIRDTAMPAVILERGFLSNSEDAALLFNAEFLDKQAQAVAEAVKLYFDIQVVDWQARALAAEEKLARVREIIG
ncbi:MAG TPA: N-acetylmuramoyl-L-alanine amidase [Firmicutes bacterium]|nr:N-acetylmuramoyl-L-alanine amidase [Bacillota bacterium]